MDGSGDRVDVVCLLAVEVHEHQYTIPPRRARAVKLSLGAAKLTCGL